MADLRRIGDLELEEDYEAQLRTWRFQRIGWVVIGLVLLAALLGVFGTGPLSFTSTGSAEGGLQVDYPRFWRYGRPMTVTVNFNPAPDADGLTRLWIDRAYVRSLRIEGITPEPERSELLPDQIRYVFRVADGQQRVSISINVQPDASGPLRGRVGMSPGEQVEFTQFIYP
jgi:hypothetical protein